MKDSLPLRGVRVHLAGSIPDDATSEQTAGIRSFVQDLAAAIFREGGVLIHGSHPTFLEPLKTAAELFVAADGIAR
jgi:hypothetical protein